MEPGRVAVVRKRKATGPSSWPRTFKASSSLKQEAPRASLPGRLTERQQLALALEESRKDSLPQQPEQEPDGSPEPSESGDQSSSLRCCEDEATTQPKGSSSSKQRSKQQLQQQGRRPSCQPCSPCRTQSHEQASTSGRVGAVASSATKTFLSSSLSSDTSKQSASTAFKVPLSRSRSGAPGAFCQPLSLPEAPGELCRSNPSSPISHADRTPANVSSSSASDLTAGGLLTPLEDIVVPQQQEQPNGTAAAESAVLSNDQPACATADRLGSLTPSISHSTSPSSHSEALRPYKKLRTGPAVTDLLQDRLAVPPAARTLPGIKIRVKLGAAGTAQSRPAAAPESESLQPLPQQPFSSLSVKRGLASAVGLQQQHAKRLKVEQSPTISRATAGRAGSFRKPRSKPTKAKLAPGAKQATRPNIPAPVYEEPDSDVKPREPPQQAVQDSCLLQACSQLCDLDRRACDQAATLVPRCSAFLELKEEEEDDDEDAASDSETEESANVQRPSPPAPSLAYCDDAFCDTGLAAQLVQLQLDSLRKSQSVQGEDQLPEQLRLGGKLGKALEASQQSCHTPASVFADGCSWLYRPLKAAAAAWNFEERAFKIPPASASRSRMASAAAAPAAGLSVVHTSEVLAAMSEWIKTQKSPASLP